MQITLMHLNDKLCLEHLTKFSLFSLRSNAATRKKKKFINKTEKVYDAKSCIFKSPVLREIVFLYYKICPALT